MKLPVILLRAYIIALAGVLIYSMFVAFIRPSELVKNKAALEIEKPLQPFEESGYTKYLEEQRLDSLHINHPFFKDSCELCIGGG